MGLVLPPGLVRRDELTADEVRSWDADLEALRVSVDDVFCGPASRENLRALVRGLGCPSPTSWPTSSTAARGPCGPLSDTVG
jgi:hypothetical protein